MAFQRSRMSSGLKWTVGAADVRRMKLFRLVASLLVVLAIAACSAATGQARWYALKNPINSAQLTDIPWRTQSYWLQPWRSTLQTRSATDLQNAIGINFNVPQPWAVDQTAHLLHNSGVRRARLELPWDGMSYANPSQPADPTSWGRYIKAFRKYGIRPLILLNANSGMPGPEKTIQLSLTAPAALGATTVALTPASAAQVVPALTGLDANGEAPGVLITHLVGNVATLSRPLPMALPAGHPEPAATLRYQPFATPTLANGLPNPVFQSTMTGWLTYVQGVSDFVRQVYGSDNFDVEVWNELGFGSNFLNWAAYYTKSLNPNVSVNLTSVTNSLLQNTVDFIHNPANGLPDVQVGDGFSDQIPWTSGTTVPAGTNGIDRHPYVGPINEATTPIEPGVLPVDALGKSSYVTAAPDVYRSPFTPNFRVFMPEFWLTGINTETIMRDLSPLGSSIYGVPHGANTHPPGAAPPKVWITEDNLPANSATADGMAAQYVPEFQAKATLRYYLSYASEGAQMIDLFGAEDSPCCQLISQRFFDAAYKDPNRYPSGLGGRPMQAVQRMTSTLAGSKPLSHPRQLKLSAIASDNNRDVQFTGNGTAAYPSLYNRDVLTFFPFQISRYKFVSAVYVMTRDLSHFYTSHPARGQTPYDLPAEKFRLTIGNVDAKRALVSLFDPLQGKQEPATIISRGHRQIVVQLLATDSPRMLTINDGPKVSTHARRPARKHGATHKRRPAKAHKRHPAAKHRSTHKH